MYSFYADESGTINLRQTNQPYYVLLAIGLNDDHWKSIDNAIVGLKKSYFPGWTITDIEIRSNDIRRASLQKWPEDKNPFSTLKAADLKRFVDDLYDEINKLPFEFCSIVINKDDAIKQHGLKKGRELFRLAYMLLIERLHGWVNQEGSYGRIFVDQQAESLLGQQHDELIEDHYKLTARGSGWQQVSRIIERPFFCHSRYSNHIQIADLLAYNVYRRYANNEGGYPFFIKTMRKVRGNMKPDGSHYGLKLYP
ncbi:MAG TPA: DUF3800 domain-containing protein [Candidatus Eremiobacteraceae bacterium]|nr:DUF3800 domain-containing protein [Candidatus Eremiobacteraceae bacterium]